MTIRELFDAKSREFGNRADPDRWWEIFCGRTDPPAFERAITNILVQNSSWKPVQRAVEALAYAPDEVLVDGLYVPKIAFASRAIVQGDKLIAEISAASILAKTARDAEMYALDLTFPQYNFKQHKGYGTAEHMRALKAHGPCVLHRRSFAPVRAAYANAALAFGK